MIKKHSHLKIRKARITDAQTILDYLAIIGSESDNLTFGSEGLGYSVEDEIKTIETMAESKNSVMFLGFIGKELVSVANLSGKSRDRMKHNATLGLSVRKAFWNQGVGKAMMKKLTDFADKNKVLEQIDLEVRSDNLNAIHLYESFGFVKTGVMPRLMKIDGEYFDTFILVRESVKQ